MPNVLSGKRFLLTLGMWETTPEWGFMQVRGGSLHLEGLLCVKDPIEKMHFRASGLSRSGSRKVPEVYPAVEQRLRAIKL